MGSSQVCSSTQQPAVSVRHRLDVDQMSLDQLAAFRAAMTAAMSISDERGYNYLAGIHGHPLPVPCGVAQAGRLACPLNPAARARHWRAGMRSTAAGAAGSAGMWTVALPVR
jgi:hypothetical protein